RETRHKSAPRRPFVVASTNLPRGAHRRNHALQLRERHVDPIARRAVAARMQERPSCSRSRAAHAAGSVFDSCVGYGSRFRSTHRGNVTRRAAESEIPLDLNALTEAGSDQWLSESGDAGI